MSPNHPTLNRTILAITVTLLAGSLLGCQEQYRWELVPGMGAQETQCLGIFAGWKCQQYLECVKRVNGKIDPDYFPSVCCWNCEAGRNACDFFNPGAHPGAPCGPDTRSTDVGMEYCSPTPAGELRSHEGMNSVLIYREFLDYLIQISSPQLYPSQVILWGDDGTGSVPGGVQFGETYCVSLTRRQYYIRIVIASHVGKPRQEVYDTIAHEYKHVLQFESQERCVVPDDKEKPWEDEAKDYANMMASKCP